MVGTVGNKGLNAHRYETGTSVPVSFLRISSLLITSAKGSSVLLPQVTTVCYRVVQLPS